MTILTRLLAVVGAAFLIISATPLVFWWATWLSGDWKACTGDVLVVPGASEHDGQVIGVDSYWRAVYASVAFRSGGFSKIVVSGYRVAPLMKDFLVSQGVPAEAILVENRSRSTRENALFSKTMINSLPGRKFLLTSDFHVRRAAAAFERADIRLSAGPLPDVRKRAQRWQGRWGGFCDVVEETVKLVYYRLRGWA